MPSAKLSPGPVNKPSGFFGRWQPSLGFQGEPDDTKPVASAVYQALVSTIQAISLTAIGQKPDFLVCFFEVFERDMGHLFNEMRYLGIDCRYRFQEPGSATDFIVSLKLTRPRPPWLKTEILATVSSPIFPAAHCWPCATLRNNSHYIRPTNGNSDPI